MTVAGLREDRSLVVPLRPEIAQKLEESRKAHEATMQRVRALQAKMDSPGKADGSAESFAQHISQTLHPHLTELGLTEDEIARVGEIFAQDVSRVAALGSKENLSKPFDERSGLLKAAISQTENELSELLGAEKAKKTMDVAATQKYRTMIVPKVAAQCSASAEPLTAESAEQLASILYRHGVSLGAPGLDRTAVSALGYKTFTSRDAAALDAAKSQLTPSQLAVLKRVLDNRYTIKN